MTLRWALLMVVAGGCGDSIHLAADAASPDVIDAPLDAPVEAMDAAADGRTQPSALAITPTSIDFGAVASGATKAVTITNGTANGVTIIETSLDAVAFSIKTDSCSGQLLAVNGSCTVTVVADDLGTSSATFLVKSTVGDVTASASATVSDVITVGTTGTASGTVTSDPAGIDCGATCSATFASTVKLTATPDSGSAFASWDNPACGTSSTCVLHRPGTAHARFAPLATLRTITLSTTGTAPVDAQIVVDDPTGDQLDLEYCTTATCTIRASDGDTVEISASSPSTLVGISGACTGAADHQLASCVFIAAGDATVTLSASTDVHELVSLVDFGGTPDFNAESELIVSKDALYRVNDDATLTILGPPAGDVFRIGPDDHLVTWIGSTLTKRAFDGTVDWSIDVGATPPDGCWRTIDCDPFEIVHPLAISPGGDVVIQAGDLLRVFDGVNGAVHFDAPLAKTPTFNVGPDSSGNVCAGSYNSTDPQEFNSVYLECFDPLGAAATPFKVGDLADTMALDVGVGGYGVILSVGVDAAMTTNVFDFSGAVFNSGAGDFSVGVSLSSQAVGFAYGLTMSDFPNGIAIQHFDLDGTGQWTVSRAAFSAHSAAGFATIGNNLRDIRVAPDGRLAIYGQYFGWGYFGGQTATSIIQLYTR